MDFKRLISLTAVTVSVLSASSFASSAAVDRAYFRATALVVVIGAIVLLPCAWERFQAGRTRGTT